MWSNYFTIKILLNSSESLVLNPSKMNIIGHRWANINMYQLSLYDVCQLPPDMYIVPCAELYMGFLVMRKRNRD